MLDHQSRCNRMYTRKRFGMMPSLKACTVLNRDAMLTGTDLEPQPTSNTQSGYMINKSRRYQGSQQAPSTQTHWASCRHWANVDP